MKKFLSLLIVICLLSLSLASCGENAKYKKALDLLEEGEDAAAYEILKELGDYKDAKEMLKNFRYVLSEVVETSIYETGEFTSGSPSKHTFTYDENNRLISWERADTRTDYTYDENGNLIKCASTSPDSSQIIEYTYDADGNMLKETWLEGETVYQIYEYAYDANGNMIKKTHFERTIASDPIFGPTLQYSIDYTYDANNRLTKQVTTRGESTLNSVEYTYDDMGNLIEESFGSGAYYYTYNKDGKLLEKKLDDALVERCTYDESGNLIKLEKGSSAWNFPTYVHEYTYDTEGKLTKETWKSDGKTSTTLEYKYDASGNLIYKTKSFGDILHYTYTYDVNGNLIEHSDVGFNYKRLYEMTYQLVYLPDGIHEKVEETICPKY